MSEVTASKPSLDKASLACFKDTLKRSKCYLEYGCGGSTVYACNVAKVNVVISIDSDEVWIDKVRSLIDRSNSRLLLEHCDIGDVGDWGFPKDKKRINDFWKYMTTP